MDTMSPQQQQDSLSRGGGQTENKRVRLTRWISPLQKVPLFMVVYLIECAMEQHGVSCKEWVAVRT